MKWLKIVILGMFLIIFSGNAIAQECLSFVNEALAQVGDVCTSTGRNQVCYGNFSINATPFSNQVVFDFNEIGDLANISEIENLQLEPYSAAEQKWGIAVLNLQANLENSLPGQSITIMAFGDTQIFYDRDSLEEPDPFVFRFQTGIGQSDCVGIEQSGLIIQTPEGDVSVDFRINNVEVSLGSIAVFTAQPGQNMTMGMIEGHGSLTAFGEMSGADGLQEVSIGMNEGLGPTGPPDQAQDFSPISTSLQYWFLKGLEFDISQTESCTITNPSYIETFGLRVGPGANRPIALWMPIGTYQVIASNSDDGNFWLRLDKSHPNLAISAANELWVKDDLLLSLAGDCSSVEYNNAPPVIQARPTAVPTSVSVPTQTARAPELRRFGISPTTVYPYLNGLECTTVSWDIEFISAMYLQHNLGNGFLDLQPLAGTLGSVVVCPDSQYPSALYRIEVIFPDGSVHYTHTVAVYTNYSD